MEGLPSRRNHEPPRHWMDSSHILDTPGLDPSHENDSPGQRSLGISTVTRPSKIPIHTEPSIWWAVKFDGFGSPCVVFWVLMGCQRDAHPSQLNVRFRLRPTLPNTSEDGPRSSSAKVQKMRKTSSLSPTSLRLASPDFQWIPGRGFCWWGISKAADPGRFSMPLGGRMWKIEL